MIFSIFDLMNRNRSHEYEKEIEIRKALKDKEAITWRMKDINELKNN